MDLYHSKETEPVDGPWHEVDKELPSFTSCKVKVKTSDDNEVFAYFYMDGAAHLFHPSCKFWDCISKEPINNVTHWKYLKEVDHQ